MQYPNPGYLPFSTSSNVLPPLFRLFASVSGLEIYLYCVSTYPPGMIASPGVYSEFLLARLPLKIVDTKLFFLPAFLGTLLISAVLSLGRNGGVPGIVGNPSSALVGGVGSAAGTWMPEGGRKLVSD